MMKYYIVDAFTDKRFHGNPAGVCLPERFPSEETMQQIAAENNLSETAFVVKGENGYDLRWFTPTTEVDLCGHATLASAFVVSHFLDIGISHMDFHTKSGRLSVTKSGDLFEMDFPSRKPEKIALTACMEEAIGAPVLEAHQSRDTLLLVESEGQVRNLRLDFDLLAKLSDTLSPVVTAKGVIVTAKGDSADFVSRFFAPGAGILEDPVTGSAHSTLIPFWAERLGKSKMTAKQLSKRGGTLYCEHRGERVKISGKAVLYLQGELFVDG